MTANVNDGIVCHKSTHTHTLTFTLSVVCKKVISRHQFHHWICFISSISWLNFFTTSAHPLTCEHSQYILLLLRYAFSRFFFFTPVGRWAAAHFNETTWKIITHIHASPFFILLCVHEFALRRGGGASVYIYICTHVRTYVCYCSVVCKYYLIVYVMYSHLKCSTFSLH